MSKFIEVKVLETNELTLLNVAHIREVTPMNLGCWIFMDNQDEVRSSDDYNDVKKFLTSS
jgi:hypothetical protein